MSDYNNPLWQRKRLEIMQRDNFSCAACGANTSTLNVHHVVYSGKPWEANDNDMQTLCEPCHSALGKHPKGGVGWSKDSAFVLLHCPMCGSTDFKDKGSYDKCNSCGHSICPDSWPKQKRKTINGVVNQ